MAQLDTSLFTISYNYACTDPHLGGQGLSAHESDGELQYHMHAPVET